MRNDWTMSPCKAALENPCLCSDRCRISTSFFRLQNTRAEPTPSLLGRIAAIAGVSPVWLLTGEGAGPQDTAAGQALRSELRELRRLLAEACDRIERMEEALGHG